MSDGSLSQDEIDALLSGIDPGMGGGSAGGARASLGEGERKAFLAIIDETLSAQGQNFLTITGLQTVFSKASVDSVNRDGLIQGIPEEVLAVTAEMTGGFPGEHVYLLSKELALRIASLANKEEGLADLDDMAISAVQEAISTLVSTEVTVFSEKTGNKSIQFGAAEGSFAPKAMAKLPEGDFVRVVYQVQIGDGKAEKLTEVFSLPFVKDIVLASGGGKGDSGGFEQAASSQGAGSQGGSFAQAMQGMGSSQGFGMPQQHQQQMGQQQMGMQMGGGLQGFGQFGAAPMMGMSPPNVQSVQFPSLQHMGAGQESGNIGLIMDVYMEMTVELGRTKKLIKEILGMGEGTIIELDKLAGEPVDILVNHKLIAKGEVVVIDENFGVRVTEIVSPMERMADLS
jgi:flagellar motor switch protein FliN/FliY